uniref:MHC class I-like antigen recognition-like domain-containing protein n=1 Tax=Gadus morhua TaxID=8049 RepID=A0A8C5FJ92_GADMO
MLYLMYRINLSVCLSAVLHSLHYFYTGSFGLTTFPEFVAVGMVDGVQIDYYDSITQKKVLKQDWMEQLTRDNPDYLEEQTGIRKGYQQVFKANIGIVKQRAHINQKMYGCEWDDDDDSTDGYEQFGYDGEDFLSLDLKTLTWVAPVQEAVTTKQRWNRNKECVDWLKKYLAYGKSTLQRTGNFELQNFEVTSLGQRGEFINSYSPLFSLSPSPSLWKNMR